MKAGWLSVFAVACGLALGCTPSPSPQSFALELFERGRPAPAFRDLGEEIYLTQDAVNSLWALVEGDGGHLIAIMQFPVGFHPYLVLVLVDRGTTVEVLTTSVYWGMVRTKLHARVDRSRASSLADLAAERYDCRPASMEEQPLGAFMVYWPEGEITVCEGGWMSDESAAVGDVVSQVLKGSRTTFDVDE